MGTRDLGVTHRSAVDAWECDQMGHMNVRFFGRRFDEAEQDAMRTLGNVATWPVTDVLTFAREARVGAPLRIETQLAAGALHHRLLDDRADIPLATLATTLGEARETSLDGAVTWTECARFILRREECVGDVLAREASLRLANHAAAHLGLDRHRARDWHGALTLGSAMVACTLYRTAPVEPGTAIRVDSRFGRAGTKSIRLLHRVWDAAKDRVVAEAEVTTVFFDMATRRSVPLPTLLAEAQR